MDVLIQYWPQLVTLVGLGVMAGYFKKRIEDVENNLLGLDLEMIKLKEDVSIRQDKTTVELTDIKVALARIQVMLEEMKNR
jgi:hypothetical protein